MRRAITIVRGVFAGKNQAAIRQRILNVAKHAQVTQPERRVISARAMEA